MILVLCAFAAAPAAAWPAATPAQRRHFETHVRPLLASHCVKCHGPAKQQGGLRLDRRDGARAVLTAGDPDGSVLIRAVRGGDVPMPPGKPLPGADVATLVDWVRDGAPWPDDAPTRAVTDRSFWSFRPLSDPAPPAVSDGRWPLTPIDRFVLARLERERMAPAPEADRRTLIRRLTYDLTGLPPTPEDVEAFCDDRRPDAYERVVDRLLASPAYGERWGRHWLDVVRYADTAGDNSDYPVPDAWRYRNWVFDALNADLPYDAFVRAQVAGDLLGGRENLIATGYLASSRRFGSYEDKRYQWYLTIEDSIENAGRAFLGLSLSCARCHDHKFDPIPTEDYYALYGFFQSTRYPWPGTELSKKPYDLIALGPNQTAYAVAEGNRWVGDAKVQRAGDPLKPGDSVPRRFLGVLGGRRLPDGETGSGRLHLAGWLIDNPLAPRVLANRLWLHHFGRGLVPTPNDFGRQGRPPSDPELLDWLAGRLVGGGWSLKAMHRLMVTSRAYRLTGEARRLDAEAVRDSLLAASGLLDRSAGGPHPFPPVGTWDFTQHKPFKAVYDTDRRAAYLMTQRIQRHPYLALFDGADTNGSTARRDSSTTPLQALFLMNDPFVHRAAASFAARLQREAPDPAARVDRAFRLAFGRPSTPEEADAAARFAGERGWESFARAVFLTSEFVYVD